MGIQQLTRKDAQIVIRIGIGLIQQSIRQDYGSRCFRAERYESAPCILALMRAISSLTDRGSIVRVTRAGALHPSYLLVGKGRGSGGLDTPLI